MKKHFFFLAMFVAATTFPASAKDLNAIAVVDFEARGVPVYEAQIIAERVRAELVQSGLFKVMERGQMESILKEQGFAQSGACTDASCVVQMGQLLSVNQIVTGSVGKLGGMYTLNVKLVDVASGEIILTRNEDVSGKIEDIILTFAIPRIAEKLINELTSGKQKNGTLSVSSSPSGAVVSVDGKDYGVTPLKKIELPIGPHKVIVSMVNHVAIEKAVVVETRKTVSVDATLNPTGEFVQQQKEKSAEKGKGVLTVARWGFGIMGLAGLGAAAYFHYDAFTKNNTYQKTGSPELATSLNIKIRNAEKFRTISAIIGGVGALGFGVTYVF